jgi:hypothetical protein
MRPARGVPPCRRFPARPAAAVPVGAGKGKIMADEDKKQLTLRIPQDVHRKVRLLAALRDQTMTELFVALVEKEYEKHAKDTGPVQLKLPT